MVVGFERCLALLSYKIVTQMCSLCKYTWGVVYFISLTCNKLGAGMGKYKQNEMEKTRFLTSHKQVNILYVIKKMCFKYDGRSSGFV